MRQARLLRIARGGRAPSWGLLVAASLACAVAASPPAAAGEKYALLIGLDDYGPGKAQGITRLGYASRDVTDMEQALTALGYKYLERPLLNQVARRLDIVRALSYHAETLTEEDTFVLFFAGHGVRARTGLGRPKPVVSRRKRPPSDSAHLGHALVPFIARCRTWEIPLPNSGSTL